MKLSNFTFSFFVFAFTTLGYGQCGIFTDGFESGSYSPTWSMGAGLSSGTVTTTNPAQGMYRLEGTGGTSTHLTGFSTSFASATPPEISWWICPQTNVALNYFVAGNSAVSATNCIVFSYYQGTSGNIRFVSSTSYDYPAILNTWYHIELKNIDWIGHTFDIYINGVMLQTSFPFRSATQNDISIVHLYNFGSGVGVWDDIQIGDDPITMSVTPTDVTCNGYIDGSIDLTATSTNPGPINYLWSNGATTEDASNLSNGIYSIWVTDGLGCSDSIMNITINQPTAISTIMNSSSTTCSYTSDGLAGVSPSGGTPGYGYLWSNSSTSAIITGLMSGTYYCTVTDTNGCTHTDSVFVGSPTPIAITLAGSGPSTCGGNQGSVDATITGGTPGYSYSWSTTATTEDIGSLVEGTYTLMVMDSAGCIDSASTVITDPTPTSVSLSIPEDSTCVTNGSFVLTGESLGGGMFSGTGVSGGSFDPSTAGLGSHTITYTYTDANNCISTAQDIIDVNGCLGFEENTLANIQVYPNPATTMVYINPTNDGSDLHVSLVNEMGQVLEDHWINGDGLALNTEAYVPGVYFLHFTGGHGQMVKKLVITAP